MANAPQTDQEIEAEVRALDLPQLRRRYTELYGEETRGGTSYLRSKVAYALMRLRDQEAQTAEPLEDEPGTGSSAEPEGLQAAEALLVEAEQTTDPAEAADLYTRAASKAAAAGCAVLAGELRKRARASNDAADQRSDDALAEWAQEGLAKTLERARAAEARGDLLVAARSWAAASMLERDRALAQQHLTRGRELERLRHATSPDAPADEHLVNVLAAASSSVGPPPASNEEKKPEAAIAKPAKERDPRLPPEGTRLSPRNGPAGLLVEFTEHTLVVMESPERPEFIGEVFPTVSSLARAYNGRNTNGYQWFGLRKPWAQAAVVLDGPTGEVASHMHAMSGIVPTKQEAVRVTDELLALDLVEDFDYIDARYRAKDDAPRPPIDKTTATAIRAKIAARLGEGGGERRPDGSLIDEPGSGTAPPAPPGAPRKVTTLEEASHAELVCMVRTLREQLGDATRAIDRMAPGPLTVLEAARERARERFGHPKLWQIYNEAQVVAAERVSDIYAELSDALRLDVLR